MNMDIKLAKQKIALFFKTLFFNLMYKAVTRYKVKMQKMLKLYLTRSLRGHWALFH